MLDLVHKCVADAWNLARVPVDAANSGMGRAEYVQRSSQSMTQAIRLLDQALVIMQ